MAQEVKVAQAVQRDSARVRTADIGTESIRQLCIRSPVKLPKNVGPDSRMHVFVNWVRYPSRLHICGRPPLSKILGDPHLSQSETPK